MTDPTRRAILHGSAALGASALTGAWRPARAASSKPPNILVIMSDEHDGAVLGCMGAGLAGTR